MCEVDRKHGIAITTTMTTMVPTITTELMLTILTIILTNNNHHNNGIVTLNRLSELSSALWSSHSCAQMGPAVTKATADYAQLPLP